jgi:hypothetical protein
MEPELTLADPNFTRQDLISALSEEEITKKYARKKKALGAGL